jgi:hypothetical protein
MLIIKRMGDLIVKLETLKDSKEWKDLCSLVEKRYEGNRIAMNNTKKSAKKEAALHSEADIIQHEIMVISDLI